MEKRKSKIVGRKEILTRFPILSQNIFSRADQLFPVRITRSWLMRVKSIDDPLGVQAFPHESELNFDDGDLIDPVGEESLSPHPWLIQKHPDRILFITTRRCHLYCRYCFRRNHTGDEDPSDEEFMGAIDYINRQNVEECILSGGDPLALSPTRLETLITKIQSPTLRIHTRGPITEPSVITPKLLSLLEKRSGLWVIVHCNHPDELTKEVVQGLTQLRAAGIPVLNQAVLLRGVNDSVDTLRTLFQRLVQEQIFPYYLHHTDLASGNIQFRVSLEKGLALYEELQKFVSGVALPKYVIDPPDGSGKIEVVTYMRNRHGKASRNP
jgi:lysine 2,3-aminomutase